jgi:hypothetical protein
MLARRCWKEPGGGTGMERGVRFLRPSPNPKPAAAALAAAFTPSCGCPTPKPSARGEQSAADGREVMGGARPKRAISVFSYVLSSRFEQ